MDDDDMAMAMIKWWWYGNVIDDNDIFCCFMTYVGILFLFQGEGGWEKFKESDSARSIQDEGRKFSEGIQTGFKEAKEEASIYKNQASQFGRRFSQELQSGFKEMKEKMKEKER